MKGIIHELDDVIRKITLLRDGLKSQPIEHTTVEYHATRSEIIQETDRLLQAFDKAIARAQNDLSRLIHEWRDKKAVAKQEYAIDEEIRRELEEQGLDTDDILLISAIIALLAYHLREPRELVLRRMQTQYAATYEKTLEKILRYVNLTPSGLRLPEPELAALNVRIAEMASPALETLPKRLGGLAASFIADGLATRATADEIAANIMKLFNPVDSAYKSTRYLFSRVLRTELSAASQLAKLEACTAAGVQEVMYLTARDSKVCRRCRKWDGAVLRVADPKVKDLIPQHPNCRCTWVPVAPPGSDWLQITPI